MSTHLGAFRPRASRATRSLDPPRLSDTAERSSSRSIQSPRGPVRDLQVHQGYSGVVLGQSYSCSVYPRCWFQLVCQIQRLRCSVGPRNRRMPRCRVKRQSGSKLPVIAGLERPARRPEELDRPNYSLEIPSSFAAGTSATSSSDRRARSSVQ